MEFIRCQLNQRRRSPNQVFGKSYMPLVLLLLLGHQHHNVARVGEFCEQSKYAVSKRSQLGVIIWCSRAWVGEVGAGVRIDGQEYLG